jgi:S-adenosylmethionine-diacylgycerolhomoserine-N-methlytransferase
MRKRMLHGREALLDALAPPPGSRIVELGAGTGAMIDLWGARVADFAALELVDLCPAMTERASRRARGRRNIRVVEADASAYRPPWPADVVYLSYSLTMIPDWMRALNNALAMLRPGGKLGIVDFYVAGEDHAGGRARHGVLTRWFWTHWFRHDHVFLSPRHLAALCLLTDRCYLHEGSGPLPYMPLLRAPYFVFVGAKPAHARTAIAAELWKGSGMQS